MHYLTKIIRFIYTHLFYIQYNQFFINHLHLSQLCRIVQNLHITMRINYPFCQLRNFNLFLFLSDFQSIKIYTAFWHSI